MSLTTGKMEYMTMSSCEVDQGTGKVSLDGEKQFTVMLNPTSFNDSSTISYNKDKSFGQAAQTPRFGAVGPKKISFEIMLDGTGVFYNALSAAFAKSVKDQITELKDLVYLYDGSKHSPNVVQLLWGSFLFYGCLENMKESYVLFKSSGEPLRANINLTFTEYKTPQEVSNEANLSSPDLTHIVKVVEGDTLMLLCNRFYKDSSYYPEVARINGLTSFRNLKPGMKIKFPPLK
jgi:LysM repeat protein